MRMDCPTLADGLSAYGGELFEKVVIVYHSRDPLDAFVSENHYSRPDPLTEKARNATVTPTTELLLMKGALVIIILTSYDRFKNPSGGFRMRPILPTKWLPSLIKTGLNIRGILFLSD